MNPIVKDKLVSALRSGDYKQTRGQLKNGDCFSVLGVLCNLYIEEFPDMGHWEGDCIVAGKIHAYELPLAVQQWSGVESEVGSVLTIRDEIQTFCGHNDGRTNYNFFYSQNIP